MAFQISGIIQQIGNTESIPYQDKVFKKRELVLDCSYRNQFTGQVERANFPKFEFTGIHVDDLNAYNIGDIVTVSFTLNGSRSERDGQVRYFTNVQGYRIEKYQSRFNNQQQGGNQVSQGRNSYQPTNNQAASQQGLQQAYSGVTAPGASDSPFPPAVNENGQPIGAGANSDLPF